MHHDLHLTPYNKHYTTTPKPCPTAAVNAIANAPQKVTRIAPLITDAPPTIAEIAPNKVKKPSENAATIKIRASVLRV